MIRIQFNNQLLMHNADFKGISESVVQLTGENIPRNTSGFIAYHLNGDFLGDYSDFTVIFAEIEGGYQFARDAARK